MFALHPSSLTLILSAAERQRGQFCCLLQAAFLFELSLGAVLLVLLLFFRHVSCLSKRIHYIEIHEENWCPSELRNYVTDHIAFLWSVLGVVPLLSKYLRAGAERATTKTIAASSFFSFSLLS